MKLADLATLTGHELGISRWIAADQARIDRFADVTEDWQDMHVDPRAARGSPYGTTVAHGFLTLSLLSAMIYDLWDQLRIEDMGSGINYGFDNLRFLAPVKSGARLRGRFVLAKVQERQPGRFLFHHDVTVEAEGETRPVLAARWLNLVMRRDADAPGMA